MFFPTASSLTMIDTDTGAIRVKLNKHVSDSFTMRCYYTTDGTLPDTNSYYTGDINGDFFDVPVYNTYTPEVNVLVVIYKDDPSDPLKTIPGTELFTLTTCRVNKKDFEIPKGKQVYGIVSASLNGGTSEYAGILKEDSKVRFEYVEAKEAPVTCSCYCESSSGGYVHEEPTCFAQGTRFTISTSNSRYPIGGSTYCGYYRLYVE